MKHVTWSKLQHNVNYWMVDLDDSVSEPAVFVNVTRTGPDKEPQVWFVGNDFAHRKQDLPRRVRFYPASAPSFEALESM